MILEAIGLAAICFGGGYFSHSIIQKFVSNAEAKAKAEADALKQSAVKEIEKL